MTDLTREIAKIESTHLGREDHGIFTAYIHVNGGGWGISVGGFGFDEPTWEGVPNASKFTGRRGVAYGMQWIDRFMTACGVARWEDLPGRTIFVLFDGDSRIGGRAVGVENLPTEPGERFVFSELQP